MIVTYYDYFQNRFQNRKQKTLLSERNMYDVNETVIPKGEHITSKGFDLAQKKEYESVEAFLHSVMDVFGDVLQPEDKEILENILASMDSVTTWNGVTYNFKKGNDANGHEIKLHGTKPNGDILDNGVTQNFIDGYSFWFYRDLDKRRLLNKLEIWQKTETGSTFVASYEYFKGGYKSIQQKGEDTIVDYVHTDGQKSKYHNGKLIDGPAIHNEFEE